MSSVDERVVKMVFDNSEFSNKISATLNSLKQLNRSTEQIANDTSGLSAMGAAFSQCEALATKAGFQIRDVWTKVANIFEQQIASKIVNTSKQIANAMTFEGISDGFKEYELKMGSIQTIMAGTGESLQTVNKYLDELNTYSDKTIYSFADMTNNIGKFTNAGVKLEDAVGAIKGIANEAALSGANANEASRAMYNFSQALSAGYVKLIDWKSIENANMATKGFKDALLQVAETVGTVKKGADGMYQVLGKNANGATMKETISATKNFNDSLAYQWMTTEVLTKTLKLYATDLTELSKAEKEAFMKDMGMDEEQFKQFEELGHKATLAASEVKTFTMLMDTLKEAIGSGWAMTWQMVIGDFNQAKELWTEVADILGGVIDAQSTYRNDTLKLWQNAGGRTDIINAMRNSFEAIQAILAPLSQGLRDVFPKYTYRTLKDISEALSDFTAKLKITEETATKVRHVTRGFFSVFDIGLQIVKGFLKAILPMSDGVSGFASGLLDASASVGDFLFNLDQTLKRTSFFEKTFKQIGEIIKPIFDVLTSGAGGAFKAVGDVFSKLAESAKGAKDTGNTFKEIGESISGGIDKIKEKNKAMSPMFQGVLSVAKGFGSVLVGILKQLGGSLSAIGTSSNPLGNFINMITAIIAGNAIGKLAKSIGSLSSITDIFDGVEETLKSFQKNLNAATLVQIATAIGIMAASLLIVASIDSKKLAGATAVITMMVFSLSGAMALLLKAVNSFSTVNVSRSFSLFGKNIFGFDAAQMLKTSVTLKAVSKALVSMGVAVALMAVGLRIVSKAAEGGHLWDSWAVVSLMLAELTGVAVILGKFGGKANKGAKSLVSMTVSLVIMAKALQMITEVVESSDKYMEAVGVISLMLGELTAVSVIIGKFGGAKGATGVIAMAISLNLIVLALKQVSDAMGEDGNKMLEALGVVSALLAELTLATVVMSKFGALGALGGAGAILAATSLLIMVQALKQVSDTLGQADQHVWQAFGVISASLVVLAIGLAAMIPSLPGAAALLVASAALLVLSGVLKIMGTLKPGEIAASLITMALALGILAVNLTLMAVAIPGALALTVAAAGLMLLAGAMAILSNIKFGAIMKALLSLTVGLLAFGAVSVVLSVAAPFVLLFAAALLALGTAITVAGVGITLLALGIQTFAAMLPATLDAIVSILNTMAEKIPEIVDTAYKSAISIIDGIATAIDENHDKLKEAVKHLLASVKAAMKDWLGEVAPVGESIVTKLKEGIETAKDKVVTAASELVAKVIEKIKSVKDDFKSAAEFLIDGLVEGLKSTKVGQAVSAAGELGNKIIGGLKSKDGLDEHSPSKKGIEAGEFVGEGAIIGLKKVADRASTAASKFGSGIINGMSEAIKGAIDNVNAIAEKDMTISPVVSPVLDLSNLRSKAAAIKGIIPQQSISAAASIGIGSNSSRKSDSEESSTTRPIQQFNYTQNNYSPKALREIDIYRQTKNQLSMAR